MPHFIQRIQTQEGSLTFLFNRIYTVGGTKYHVSVMSGRLSHYFIMHDGEGSWHFANIRLLPSWIIALRKEIEAAINQDLNEFPGHV
jgi:hypothetical protein